MVEASALALEIVAYLQRRWQKLRKPVGSEIENWLKIKLVNQKCANLKENHAKMMLRHF